MSKEISKSSKMLEKEAKINALQKQLKSRKSTLKGLKTRLSNSKKEIEDLQYKTSAQAMGVMARIDELRQEIAALAKKLKNTLKGLSKADKSALEEMEEAFSDGDIFGPDFQAYQERKEAYVEEDFNFDEEARAKMRDLFEDLHVKPTEQEHKDIRKIFVRLSNKFHPDRARNKKEEAEFHELQQQLNEAYQSGDIHTLLELERLLLTEEIDLTEPKSYTIDVLQQALDRLEKELQFIENQINRTRQEIKNLKESNLGEMLSGLRKAKRDGYNIDDSLAEMEKGIQEITKLRDALKDSLEQGKVSPKLMNLVMGGGSPIGDGPMNMSPEEAEEMLASLFGDGGEDMLQEMFGEMMDDASEQAKFKTDQTVKIKKSNKHPYIKGFNLKGCVGRVVYVEYADRGQLNYTIDLDSISLKRMPPKEIKNCLDGGDFFQQVEILEKDLVACEARDTQKDFLTTYRTLLHQNVWNYINKAQATLLQSILLAYPDKTDLENWEIYLKKNLQFPFEAKVIGQFNVLPPNIKVSVLDLEGINEEDGIIISMKIGRDVDAYPLVDLKPIDKKSTQGKILAAYLDWADELLDTDDDDFFF